MMVMDEFCDKWSRTNAGSFYADFDKVWQKDLTSFIERDRNHPSVVMWSLGNEVVAAGKVPAYIPDTLKMLVPFAKKLDNTRPYTHACVSGWSDAPGLAALADVEDVVGVNYQDFLFGPSSRSTRTPCSAAPNKTLIRSPAAKSPPGIRSGTSPMSWAIICGRAWIIWARSSDSLGGHQRLPRQLPVPQVMVLLSAKPMERQAHGPYRHRQRHGQRRARCRSLAETWNQTGRVNVVTYTSCDTVDLYVNSTKIGTKNRVILPQTVIMQWTSVPWEAGVIKAVGMKNGKEAATDSIKTAGAPAKIVLKPDRTTLYADGNDASCIEVDIRDADNNLVFAATNTVQFAITGPGRSLGIASGDWTSNEPFKATSRKAYHGKVLIVIQSTLVSRNDQRDGEFAGFDSGHPDPDHPPQTIAAN